jgi:protocatechuate 3,4-dioxygenase beta subunit
MSEKRATRREALALIGVTGVAVTIGCGGDTGTTPDPGATTSSPTMGTSGTCAASPNETAGPYPSLNDIVRGDIRGGRPGVPLTLTLTVVNASSACSAVSGAMVEVWQCDAQGRYSEYSQPGYDGRSETFLRGTQTTDANGRVSFMTIYPGWYAGRATHIHAEVTLNGRAVKVTQMAFPESVNNTVYASSLYATRGPNPTANAGDMVFADSLSSELATISGDPSSGYTASFTIGI